MATKPQRHQKNTTPRSEQRRERQQAKLAKIDSMVAGKAALERKITLQSPEAQWLFFRYIDRVGADCFTLSREARNLDAYDVAETAERLFNDAFDKLATILSEDMGQADKVLDENGITGHVTYGDVTPIPVKITTPLLNRYVLLIEQLDQVFVRVETLLLYNLGDPSSIVRRQTELKRRLVKQANKLRATGDECRHYLAQQAERNGPVAQGETHTDEASEPQDSESAAEIAPTEEPPMAKAKSA